MTDRWGTGAALGHDQEVRTRSTFTHVQKNTEAPSSHQYTTWACVLSVAQLRPARREGALLRSFVEQVQGLVHDDPTHVVISERQLAEAMQANEGRQGGLMSRGGHMRSQSATTGTGPSRKVVVFNWWVRKACPVPTFVGTAANRRAIKLFYSRLWLKRDNVPSPSALVLTPGL